MSSVEYAKALLGAYAAPYVQQSEGAPSASGSDFKSLAQSLAASSSQAEVLLGDKKTEKVVQSWLDRVQQLLSSSSTSSTSSSSADPSDKSLQALEKEIEAVTFVSPTAAQPTAADIGLFAYLSPLLSSAPAATQHALPSLARYASHISQLPDVVAAAAKVPAELQEAQGQGTKSWTPVYEGMPKIERVDLAAEKAKAKAEKAKAAAAAAAAGAGSAAAAAAPAPAAAKKDGAAKAAAPAEQKEGQTKKEKKEKNAAAAGAAGGEAKPKKEKAGGGGGGNAAKNEPTRPLPSQVDLRVGKIVDIKKHPDADSLYLETVDFGEAEGPRTVLSGLVKYCTLEEMQNRMVVGICNLKPVAMRGIKSHAMLLCATNKEGAEKGGVEPVLPPEGSVPGDKLWIEGYEGLTPDAQLNPKKKIFEAIQPGYLTTADKQAAWKGVGPDEDPATAEPKVRLIRGDKGVVYAPRFDGATLS